MRIIAIDPGYDRIGVAILEKGESENLIFSECIFTDRTRSVGERIFSAVERVGELIREYEVEVFVIEELFFAKNTKTALTVAEARGALIYRALKEGLPVYQLTPNQVKLAITGNGNASKRDLFFFLKRAFPLPDKQFIDDEIDAIAIGISFFSYERFLKLEQRGL